jgi:predicted RNA-binding Zn-ribbon protein involved in translation (DUF1610 family)
MSEQLSENNNSSEQSGDVKLIVMRRPPSDEFYEARKRANWRQGAHTKKKKFICTSCGERAKLQPQEFRKSCPNCKNKTLTRIPWGGIRNIQTKTDNDDLIYRCVDGSFESNSK